MTATYSEPQSLRTISEKRPEPEPTFGDAQRWWKPMRQAVAFPGVPGYPWQPSVLWNSALQFWPVPGAFGSDAITHSANIGMAQELSGHETDALQTSARGLRGSAPCSAGWPTAPRKRDAARCC